MAIHPSHALARRSMVELGKLVVPDYGKRLWWYQRELARTVEGLIRYARFKGKRGGYSRAVVSMPPRHGKSLHGTELLPVMAHGIAPDLKIIAATHTSALAQKGVTNAAGYMAHDNYQRTFATRIGKVLSVDDRTGEPIKLIDATHTAKKYDTLRPVSPGSREYVKGGGYYMAQGIGGSLTGEGFEIGILDDPIKNAVEAMSSLYHSRLWSFYTSTFDTRANSEHAVQIYIGTRWNDPDFVDELQEYWHTEASAAGRDLAIKILRFPALAEDPLEPGDPREIGEGLDKPPEQGGVFSTKSYEGKKASLMAREPWVWFALYQQRPRATGAKFFQPCDWLTYNHTFRMADMLTYVDFSVDTGLTDTGASFSVISVFGVLVAGSDAKGDAGEHFFLLDEARGHWDLEPIAKELQRLWLKWSTELPRQARNGSIFVEAKALGPQLIKRYQGTGMPLVAVPKSKSKLLCYRVAAPVSELNRVRIPSGTWGRDPTNPALPLVTDEWVGSASVKGSWVHELMSFPSKPDDRRDTLAQELIMRTSWIDETILGKA